MRRRAAIRVSGMPHRPKPPAIIVAPSKKSATASSALATVLSIVSIIITRPGRLGRGGLACCGILGRQFGDAHRDVHHRLRRPRRLRWRPEGRGAVARARRRRWSTSRTASRRATWRRARWRSRRRRRCSPPGRSTSWSSIPAWGGRAPIWSSRRAAASSSAPTTACCRWRPAARAQIFRIEAPAFRREPVSPTFHGRDVFAPAAGRLAAGAARLRGRAGARRRWWS